VCVRGIVAIAVPCPQKAAVLPVLLWMLSLKLLLMLLVLLVLLMLLMLLLLLLSMWWLEGGLILSHPCSPAMSACHAAAVAVSFSCRVS
jgi:hypothetical protein